MRKEKTKPVKISKVSGQRLAERKPGPLEQLKKEIRVETSLDKVRKRTLRMKDSKELELIAALLYSELEKLKLLPRPSRTFFSIINKENKAAEVWMSMPDGQVRRDSHLTPLNKHSQLIKVYEAWKNKKSLIIRDLKGRSLDSYLKFLKTLPHVSKDKGFQKMIKNPPVRICITEASFRQGTVGVMTTIPLIAEAEKILTRFAKVFELAYTRFLDLQKAEAQVREAELELALERVRARTMSMHNSDELREIVRVINNQLEELGFESNSCNIIIIDKDSGDSQFWASGFTKDLHTVSYHVPYLDHPYYNAMLKPWKEGKKYVVYRYEVEGKKGFDEIFFTKTEFKNAPEEVKNAMISLPTVNLSTAFFSHGALQVVGTTPIPEEKAAILQRFAKIFQQTYTRFLDLQKAEAQARESEIQLALERVRARTMAMHKSDELSSVASVLFHQLQELNLPALRRCLIGIVDEKNEKLQSWHTSLLGDSTQKVIDHPIDGHPVIREKISGWRKKKPFSIELSPAKLNDFINYLIKHGFEYNKGEKPATKLIQNHAPFKYGYLEVATHESITEHDFELLQRFAKVFEQTYTRFLDLQKAEAQAQESEIQLALERVRARTMAMHKSEELNEVVKLLYDQITPIGISAVGIVIANFQPEADVIEFWQADHFTTDHLRSYKVIGRNNSVTRKVWEAWEQKKPFIKIYLEGDEHDAYVRYLLQETDYKDVSEKFKAEMGINTDIHFAYIFTKYGFFQAIGAIESDEQNIMLLQRFAQVFEQTYTRFLDLQKAEAQAREAQIEAALERVRASMMAMHKSEELREVIASVFEQLKGLGFDPSASSLGIYNEDLTSEHWFAGYSHEVLPKSYKSPHCPHPYYLAEVEGWKKQLSFNELIFEGKAKVDYAKWMFKNSEFKNLPVEFKNEMLSPKRIIISNAYMKYGFLEILGDEPVTGETASVLKRFAKVFEQTYTRFLDLQKAEAQAREAEIQLSLERIRARTVAMHKSEELGEVAETLYAQLQQLGVSNFINCGYLRVDEKNKTQSGWASMPGDNPMPFNLPFGGDSVLTERIKAWKSGAPLIIQKVSGKELAIHLKNVIPSLGTREMEEMVSTQFTDPTYFYNGCLSSGYLFLCSTTPLEEDHVSLFERFTRAFELSFKRFLDLQKAEAQAREGQVQLALERVRSRSMAMHKSDELKQVVEVLTDQFKILNAGTVTCWISLVNVATNTMEIWIWNVTDMGSPNSNYIVNGKDYHSFQSDIDAFKNKESFRQFSFDKDAAKRLLKEQFEFELTIPKGSTDYHLLQYRHHFGFIGYASWSEPGEQGHSLLQRFAKVFEQNYTRFLDLQKAEAQAREAKIEAALEKVRSRSLAMHNSNELQEVVNTVFGRLKDLEIEMDSASIHVPLENSKDMEVWVGNQLGVYSSKIRLPYFDHIKWVKNIYNALRSGKDLMTATYHFEEKNEMWKYIFNNSDFKLIPEERKRFVLESKGYTISFACNKNTGIQLARWSEKIFSEKEYEVLKRFAKVFEQTYTRFLDLQKAETQAREAQIEAGLERVRSRTLAMQNSVELAETAAVLFQQLIYLGIAPNRLYIGITEDNSPDIEFWITDEDGSKVSTMFRGNADKNISIKKMVDAWKHKEKSIVIEIHGKELEDYFHYLGEELHVPFKGGLSQKRRWQYIACFSKGFIGMASPDEQPAETLQLLERFAYVFNLTFTRFNDLKVAEAHALRAERDLIEIKEARKKAEEALSELQSTQRQLIQSEKMASLGELTAGIAHEIQNPLNFVNNFSEVSKELMDEIKEEIAKGNLDDAKDIMDDVIRNLEKINHHGKRADVIVKGMLQHSRSSSGVKDPTDINALCEEYLRLAYHGLRAKEKSFSEGMPLANVKYETDFDPSLPKINVVPQDIGRVVLNLINNAFYAVSEKVKQNINGYDPLVEVSTKKINGIIQISVKDNGLGIPDNIKDKIFQPFFTTKPTGQGTGLGLSLSYDIVKAHGGELKVETKVDEGNPDSFRKGEGLPAEASAQAGTEFIIHLPI